MKKILYNNNNPCNILRSLKTKLQFTCCGLMVLAWFLETGLAIRAPPLFMVVGGLDGDTETERSNFLFNLFCSASFKDANDVKEPF